MSRRSFLAPMLLRLILLVLCVSPFAIGRNTLTVFWQQKTYSISLAVAVFLIIVVFMVVQAIVMQFYDFGTTWRRYRARSLVRRLERAGDDVRLLLTHSTNGADTRKETKRLSRSLASRPLADWGVLQAAQTHLERTAHLGPMTATDKRAIKTALAAFRSLKKEKAFSTKREEVQTFWRLAQLCVDSKLRDEARILMHEHDPSNDQFCLEECHRALAEGSWRRAFDHLEFYRASHVDALDGRVARIWLEIADRAHTEAEREWSRAKKNKQHDEDESAMNLNQASPTSGHAGPATGTVLQTAGHFDAQSGVTKALHNAVANDSSLKERADYWIPAIASACRDGQLSRAKRQLRTHAVTVAGDQLAATLWLRANGLEGNSEARDGDHRVIESLQKWTDLCQRHPESLLAMIKISYSRAFPGLAEPLIEELLTKRAELSASFRERLIAILVQVGVETYPYLKRLHTNNPVLGSPA